MEHLREAMTKLWKDCHRGRVLLCTEAAEAHLHGVHSSPCGRVVTLNPDRSVATEGRMIHDQRLVNATGNKHEHPPGLATEAPIAGESHLLLEDQASQCRGADVEARHRRSYPLDLA